MLLHLDLFSGCGGFSLAAEQLGGIQTTQLVEINPDAQLILKHQFPDIPIHSDISCYRPESGEFDLITMGFPCTGTSNAGSRTGLQHPASSLWREGLRCLIEAQPKFCIMEQPQGIIRRGLRAILGGLSLAGYSFEIETISAAELGASHQRFRLFIISYPDEQLELYEQTCWSDQMRLRSAHCRRQSLVQRQRLDSEWLSVKRTGNGFDYGISPELVRLSVPSRTPGRIRSRYLAGRTVTPPQAAVALRRVLYLNSITGGGDEKLLEHKRGEHSTKSQELSIPCLVKQPNQSELKGIIRKDLGDCPKGSGGANRFIVYIPHLDKSIAVSKLFVYPDFSKSDEQIPPTKKATPPSKNSPTKTRRKKGDGTGYLYSRTITRRGKQYQEHYYRYRDESGKLRAKYIPQKLLDRIQEAESQSLSVADVLKLLGVNEISRGEQFSTSDDEKVLDGDRHNQLISISRGEQVTPPSTKKRKQGEGTGYIECKPIKRGGNEYKQYWYHYEEWRSGDRLTKKSRYIPKRLLAKVEKMNNEKAPVEEILKVLRRRKKRR